MDDNLFEYDAVLPGVITEILSDYNSGYDESEWGTTDSEIVIGTAFDGPVGKLVKIYTPEHGRYIFGPSYDATTRKEATLVSGIKDAYDRGCRTIYATRVSGIPIYKDFDLAIDTTLKLRVSGFFPSNNNKDVYAVFDNTIGDLKFSIYKPSSRATIQEKMNGLVESDNSIMVNTMNLSGSYGLTRDSKLTDFINIVNSQNQNNVLKLFIVDSNGVDVTQSSTEAQSLALGAVFPGLYTIGRDTSLCAISTKIDYNIATSSLKPYSSFDGLMYKELKLNSDVSANVPIFGSLESLNSKFRIAGLTMSTMFDILTIPNQIDYLFQKDTNDYEEVDCKNFDLYRKLGSGFAITAKATYKDSTIGTISLADGHLTERYIDTISGIKLSPMMPSAKLLIGTNISKLLVDATSADSNITIISFDNRKIGTETNATTITPEDFYSLIQNEASVRDIRVIETPTNDSNRIAQLTDGIYSMLENAKTNYRVLMNGNADEDIVGKLPSKSDFRVISANQLQILNNNIIAETIVNTDDKYAPKKYKFQLIHDINPGSEIESMLYKDMVATEVSLYEYINNPNEILKDVNKNKINYKNSSLFLMRKQGTTDPFTLYRFNNFTMIESSNATVFSDLENTFLFSDNKIFKGTKTLNSITFNQITNKNDINSIPFSYILVESLGNVYVYRLNTEAATGDIIDIDPIGEISEALEENTEKIMVCIQSAYCSENTITINSGESDYLILTDFIDYLNDEPYLNKLFKFSLSNYAIEHKDNNLEELSIETRKFNEADSIVKNNYYIYNNNLYIAKEDVDPAVFDVSHFTLVEGKYDSTIQYNTSLYIPYKTTDTFDRHLAQHCKWTSLKTFPTHGVIGVSKLIDYSNLNSITKKVNSLINMKHSITAKKSNGNDMLDKNNVPFMIGKDISIIVGQYQVATLDNYNYISNGAAGYAGMISALPLEQSSTAQHINIDSPMYEFTNYQLEQLTLAGFVTVKNSFTQGYVITDGITQAESTSVFNRLSNTRIVNYVELLIRSAVEPYIGKENHTVNRNSMKTAINSKLTPIKGIYIEDYDFNLRQDTSAQKIGIVYIDYTLIPIYEIRQVINSIKINK